MSHGARCPCGPCKGKRRAKHIRTYYAKLPPDERYARSAKRRAESYGVVSAPYSRTEILARWGGTCGYGCGRPAVHLDHIVPLSKGGEDVEANIIPACADENLSKGAKTLAEWALSDPNVKEIK